MSTATDGAEEILRRMGQIRREMHEDVREVVTGAEAVADWRRYVRMYPLAALSVAAAAGYLVVPKRRQLTAGENLPAADIAALAEALKQQGVLMPAATQEKKRKSLVAAGLAMLAPLAWRAVQNYAMAYLEQWILQQQQQFMAGTGPQPPHEEPAHPWPSPPPTGERPRGSDGSRAR